MTMFGSVDTIFSENSQFNNADESQINLSGHIDNFAALEYLRLFAQNPHGRGNGGQSTTMFQKVKHMHAQGTTFNNSQGSQWNLGHSQPSVQLPDIPLVSAAELYDGPPYERAEPSSPAVALQQDAGFAFLTTASSQISTSHHADIPLPSSFYQLPCQNEHSLTPRSLSPLQRTDSSCDPPNQSPSTNNDRPTITDAALGVSSIVLQTLQTAAQLAPIPLLQQAAGIALNILNSVQKMNDTEGGFKRLGAHVATLIASVVAKQNQHKTLSPELFYNLQQLVGRLRPIAKFTTEWQDQKSQRLIRLKRFFLTSYNAGKVVEYREMLTNALTEFTLQLGINMQDGISQILFELSKIPT